MTKARQFRGDYTTELDLSREINNYNLGEDSVYPGRRRWTCRTLGSVSRRVSTRVN